MGLAVITITKNEERNIAHCLESVRWADEIIIVDSCSTDRTVELAREYTDRVWVREWHGYGETKNFALQKAAQNWILWLDADERVSPELAAEIRHIVSENRDGYAGYDVARRAYFLGKWIRHCGWYPGYVTRLFRKASARFSASNVHERVELTGRVGRLQHDLLHFTDNNLYHYFSKFNRYTSLAAEDLFRERKHFSLKNLLLNPPYLFVKMYFLRLGFLDGMRGLILSLASASYVFIKYAKLQEQYRRAGKRESTG